MARGWESKSVADQQADREAVVDVPATITPDDAARGVRRRTLELARARAAADLAAATQPAHRAMLEAALRALDARIQE